MIWDERYAAQEFHFGEQPNTFLQEQAHRLKPNSDILMLCEGEGRNGVFLAQQGHHITGIDASAVGLEKAQQLARQKGVSIQTQAVDLSDYQFEANRWNAIVAIFAHLDPALRVQVHRSVVSALKPGGLLILEAYRPEQLNYGTGGPPTAERMMTREGLTQEFSGLEIVQITETVRPVVEGVGHTGDGAVIQLIAQKP